MQAADPESVSWLRFAFASVTVVGLMAALAWGLKYMTMRGWLSPRLGGGSQNRLRVTASLPLDARRRVVIVECDETEYHLLLGASNDLLLATRPAPEMKDTSPPPKPH